MRIRRFVGAYLSTIGMIAAMFTVVSPAQAIVNGTAVDYPWAVALALPSSSGGSIESRTLCSGVLIKQSWVLTAAHCFDLPDCFDRGLLDWQHTTVIIGRDDLESVHGETRTIAEVHNMCRSSTYCPSHDPDLCDLALLKLSSPSTKTDADLADGSVLSYWNEGTDARIYGYGQTNVNSRVASRYLRRADEVIDEFRPTHATLWAHGINNAPCGDDGGPLIVTTTPGAPRVVGIVRAAVDPAKACSPSSDNETSYMKVGWRGTTTNSPAFTWIQAVV